MNACATFISITVTLGRAVGATPYLMYLAPPLWIIGLIVLTVTEKWSISKQKPEYQPILGQI